MNQDKELPIGTIVKLKSGGPDMAVQSIVTDMRTNKPNGHVVCQWFAGKKLEKGTFPVASLDLVKPEPKAE